LVDVVVHTHWDREWYMDRETTLARLQAVMERVADDLDAARLAQFLFDGQTVALEDLLSCTPANLMQRLKAHAQTGRLVLGPWYVASDEFLVSGESLMRNLALGMELSQAWGGAQAVGYLPDTFGHAAQMPQILRQFGIDHAVVWRGADAPEDLFDWCAPEGSRVTTAYLSEGYYLHPLHGPDWQSATESLLQRLQAQRDRALGGPLLLTHGGDHLAPHPQIQERMEAFNRLQSRFALRQRTLLEHIRQLGASEAPRPVLHGELRRNSKAFVLPDVLSSRRHLKRLHQAAEDRLLGEIEPLMARWGADEAALDALDRAWRLLLQQQAHDSICGCSTDEVHAEMALRFQQLQRGLDALQRRVMQRAGLIDWDRHLAQTGPAGDDAAPMRGRESRVFDDDRRFTLFNPLPRRREGWFEVSVFLHGTQRDRLCIQDESGNDLPSEILQAEEAFELISPLDEFPERMNGWRYVVAVRGEWEGLEAKRLWVQDGPRPESNDGDTATAATASPAPSPAPSPTACSMIDNDAWRVELDEQGRLWLTDLRQPPAVARRLDVISESDAGDTYNHSPPKGCVPVSAQQWRHTGGRTTRHLQELQVEIRMTLPAGLNEDRSGVLQDQAICEGLLTLRLLGDEPVLRLQLQWHNRAADQRTRLVLAGLPATTTHTWRDTAFAWTAHPVRLSEIPEPIGRREAPVCVQPSLSAVAAGPWMAAHRALHEHEIVRDPDAQAEGGYALGFTLVRSVGWMSRRDLRTRGVGAGPDLPTPQAQCLGEDLFELMLLAHPQDSDPHAALQAAQILRRPMLALRGHSQSDSPDLDVGDLRLEVSACRRLRDGRVELRLWNPTPEAVMIDGYFQDWTRVRADGHAREGRDVRRVAPHEIITLRSTEEWGLS
jgi:hypothetical protein